MPQLPDVEDESIVTTGRGYGSSHALLVAYARLLQSVDRAIQYHFELLNLGYAAYVPFYAVCREAFPDITDQAIASLVSGVDLLPLRPDEELKTLTPFFSRVSAVVVDIGGIMCHAAILAREYGLPTVVGTGSATKRLKTGDRLRVDGNTGVVTVLD